MDLPQHMEALQKANAVRLRRRELKRGIADGEITAAEVIYDPPIVATGMTVLDILTAQHRWGRTRALRLLVVAGVREGKPLGELTERQRRILADLLMWGTA